MTVPESTSTHTRNKTIANQTSRQLSLPAAKPRVPRRVVDSLRQQAELLRECTRRVRSLRSQRDSLDTQLSHALSAVQQLQHDLTRLKQARRQERRKAAGIAAVLALLLLLFRIKRVRSVVRWPIRRLLSP
ncbi:MAG: hypothetical protein MHM6MM_008430 [Cercozoa sp. M6MM]